MNRAPSIMEPRLEESAESQDSAALDALLAVSEQELPPYPQMPSGLAFPGAVVGRLVGLGLSGEPRVHLDLGENDVDWPARSVVPVALHHLGAEVVLTFENGDRTKPIILGILASANQPPELPLEVTADEERLELKADREIVLRCGKASITLTRAGKVLIRGAYVSSRSSGANRIKGGSVQIN